MTIILLIMILTMMVMMTMLLMMMITPWCKVVTSIWWCLSMTHSIIWPCPPPYSHIQVAPASGEVFLPVFFLFLSTFSYISPHSFGYLCPLSLVPTPILSYIRSPCKWPAKEDAKSYKSKKMRKSTYASISSTVQERHFRMSSM